MGKRSLKSRAQELLEFARSLHATGLTWVEANNAIYGAGGRFPKLFPTKTERLAFARMAESRKLDLPFPCCYSPNCTPVALQ
jgi:hypothetical protein